MRSKARHAARLKPKLIAKHEHRHYLPYLPVLAIVLAIFSLTIFQPITKIGILSYATEMSKTQLLASTNDRRAKNGSASLNLNSKLNAAAQAKADDMVKRNYWSHDTPDGQEPWVFFDNAGYKYLKAGENLAYGFATSDGAVTGWMNSPSHKANMLDPAFSEVGFGFANGENYNKSGNQTVVVAEYGKPQVLAESDIDSSPTPAAQPSPSLSQAPVPAPSSGSEISLTALKEDTVQPVNSDNKSAAEPATRQVSRIEALTGGRAPWAYFAMGLPLGVAVTFLLAKHLVDFRKFLRRSERFIFAHPLLDTTLVGFILIGVIFTQTTGFIK